MKQDESKIRKRDMPKKSKVRIQCTFYFALISLRLYSFVPAVEEEDWGATRLYRWDRMQTPSLSIRRSQLAAFLLRPRHQHHSGRWNGSREDYSIHLLPLCPPQRGQLMVTPSDEGPEGNLYHNDFDFDRDTAESTPSLSQLLCPLSPIGSVSLKCGHLISMWSLMLEARRTEPSFGESTLRDLLLTPFLHKW